MPWRLASIFHHVSGYSAVVFVGYATVAYQFGFTLYIWLVVVVGPAMVVGAFSFAPR